MTLLGFPFRLGCDSLLLQAGETHDSCGYTVGFIGEGPSRVGGEVNGCEGSAEDVGDCVGYGRVGPRGGGAELRDGPASLARLGVSLQCRGACGPVEPHGTRAHAFDMPWAVCPKHGPASTTAFWSWTRMLLNSPFLRFFGSLVAFLATPRPSLHRKPRHWQPVPFLDVEVP